MIKVDKQDQKDLLKYFHKKDYDTNEILKDPIFAYIMPATKKFLLNLSFEENGRIKEDVLFSDQVKNSLIIETFFTNLIAQYGANARDIFITTSEDVVCDFSSLNVDEQVKCIKKFLIKKYSRMYKNMRNIYGKKLIQSSELFICPYCSRSYIGVIESEKNSKSITPDLDHFYPKSRYPFLAVTLSNLVPACLFCNQRAKSSVDFYKSSIYPPQKIFDEIEFDFDVYMNKIYIKNYGQLISRPEYKTHLETFLIQEVYASHTEVLKSIINKAQKYRKSKIEDIAKYTMGLSASEIKKIVFFEYEFMSKKRELLYKLKQDLYKLIVLEQTE
jgi:hypothetical protein